MRFTNLIEYEPVEIRDGLFNDNYYGDGHGDIDGTKRTLPGMTTFATKNASSNDPFGQNI